VIATGGTTRTDATIIAAGGGNTKQKSTKTLPILTYALAQVILY
jgi:hypothetical protein